MEKGGRNRSGSFGSSVIDIGDGSQRKSIDESSELAKVVNEGSEKAESVSSVALSDKVEDKKFMRQQSLCYEQSALGEDPVVKAQLQAMMDLKNAPNRVDMDPKKKINE